MTERTAKSSAARASLSSFGTGTAVPPPPAGPSLTSRQQAQARDEPAAQPPAQRGEPVKTGESRVFPFDAELEMAEIDSGKAGLAWSARARTLSTSSLTITSRRMCYVDRLVVIAVHRLDNEPMMLLGRIADCGYESDGLYVIEVELLPTDEAAARVTFSRRKV